MNRIRELIAEVNRRYPDDPFFAEFEYTVRLNPDKRRYYRTYDEALSFLDLESWAVLKAKALNHFRDHRRRQLKQGFFNQINDAFAYRILVRQGYSRVRILPETGRKVPDIEYKRGGKVQYCEVKTISISDDEIGRRDSCASFNSTIYATLSSEFLSKLQSVVSQATTQIQSHGENGLIFVILINDDLALDHYAVYRRQILDHFREKEVQEIYIKVGLRGHKRIRIPSQWRGHLRAAHSSAAHRRR